MHKGVITKEYKKRICDHIADAMLRMKLYKTDGYYPIFDDRTGKECGAFVCVYGNKIAIKFLEKITDYRGKNCRKVTIDY